MKKFIVFSSMAMFILMLFVFMTPALAVTNSGGIETLKCPLVALDPTEWIDYLALIPYNVYNIGINSGSYYIEMARISAKDSLYKSARMKYQIGKNLRQCNL